MNNFFLLNEAIDLDDYDTFIEGMSELVAIDKEQVDVCGVRGRQRQFVQLFSHA